jgi:enoyl-CoA hydratase/carnithine racemase
MDVVRCEADAASDGAVVTLRLDRAPMNALSRRLLHDLAAQARAVSRDSQVRAAVLFGGPKNFCSGLDRREFASACAPDTARVRECFDVVADIAVPVVAAVTGYALGGGLELALCADVRVAGDNVRIGDPEALRDIDTAGRGERLLRHVGPSRAKDLLFSGRHLGASEASDWGLVDHVVSADGVYGAALELARTYAAVPAMRCAMSKPR